MTERVDTRPLRSAAQAQTGVVVAGALGSGAGGGLGLLYLSSLSQFGFDVSRNDLLIAFMLSVAGAATPSVLAQLRALSRVVRDGEKDTTPWRDPRNDRGEQLRPPSPDMLREAVEEVAWSWGYDRPVARPPAPEAGPSGTSVQRAADRAGPPSVDPSAYTGRASAAREESWRERSGDPRVRRGRDVADRADRRAAHAYDPARR